MALPEEQNRVEPGSPEAKALEELVERCGAGDIQSLKDFFARFSADIYNFPLKVFHLDEDAASDFYLYAFERLKDGGRFRSFQGRSSFRTWFYTVLRNLVIDWMRTIREVETVQVNRYDESGNEYPLIENTPDPRTVGINPAFLRRNILADEIRNLPVEMRAVFKLSYIFYLDLEGDEIEYVSEKSGKPVPKILEEIARLKHELAGRELKNIDQEDKITSLYLMILDLKNKRERLLQTTPPTVSVPGGELPGGLKSADEAELMRLDQAIAKKYQQREKLLYKKKRGHFVVRTPYREISQLVGIPEGSVSVQMMRVNERLRASVDPDRPED